MTLHRVHRERQQLAQPDRAVDRCAEVHGQTRSGHHRRRRARPAATVPRGHRFVQAPADVLHVAAIVPSKPGTGGAAAERHRLLRSWVSSMSKPSMGKARRARGALIAVSLLASAAVAPAAPETGRRRLTYEEAFAYAREGSAEIPLAERQVLAELPRIVEWLDDERWVESRADLANPGRRRLFTVVAATGRASFLREEA